MLKTYTASGRAIELEAKKVVEAHEESLLTDLVYGNADRVDLNVVFEAALGDDRIALVFGESSC